MFAGGSMEIKTEIRDGVTIVEIAGNIDSNTAPEAQGAILPLIVLDCRMVLDMEQCHYVSSAGLRVLLMIAKLLATKGGQCALAKVSDEIKDVMDITGFASFFKTYDTVSAAVEAFRK
jgi:anti-sigma B factor antagonist